MSRVEPHVLVVDVALLGTQDAVAGVGAQCIVRGLEPIDASNPIIRTDPLSECKQVGQSVGSRGLSACLLT